MVSFLKSVDELAMGVTAGFVSITSTSVLNDVTQGLCITGNAVPGGVLKSAILITVLSSIIFWPRHYTEKKNNPEVTVLGEVRYQP